MLLYVLFLSIVLIYLIFVDFVVLCIYFVDLVFPCIFLSIVMFYSFLFVNGYFTIATGILTNCSYEMYHIITHIILYHYQCETGNLIAGDVLVLCTVIPQYPGPRF